jgi:hypothetical protein
LPVLVAELVHRQVAGILTGSASSGARVERNGRKEEETWHILEVLRREKMATFQEVMDEAISDFLKKNNRPVTLKAALKQSAGKTAGGKPRHRKSHPSSSFQVWECAALNLN